MYLAVTIYLSIIFSIALSKSIAWSNSDIKKD